MNVKRGDSAWSAIKEANQFNEAPSGDYEYLLTKFRFKVLDTSDDKEYAVSSYNFKAVSQDGVVYDSSWVVVPKPELSNSLYPDASVEGWIVFKIKKTDANPLIRFTDGNDNELWFNIM